MGYSPWGHKRVGHSCATSLQKIWSRSAFWGSLGRGHRRCRLQQLSTQPSYASQPPPGSRAELSSLGASHVPVLSWFPSLPDPVHGYHSFRTQKGGTGGDLLRGRRPPSSCPLSPCGRAPPQVQSELRRTWRGLWPSRPSARDRRLHSLSISRTGSDGALQGSRGSRAPSLLQTETSVI